MPEISRFYGLVIRMHPGDHSPPHFHADYPEHDAAIAIAGGRLLAGSLPPRAMRLVVEWAQAHQSELEHDWQLATRRLPLDRIEPLRKHDAVLTIVDVEPLPGRCLRLTLSNGQVVERDVSDLIWGPVFERIAASDSAFAEVVADGGTAACPADGADLAPETLIWNGPYPPADTDLVPPDFAVVVSPIRPPR